MKLAVTVAAAAALLFSAAPTWAQSSPLVTAPMANGPGMGGPYSNPPGRSAGFPGTAMRSGPNGTPTSGGPSTTVTGGPTGGAAMH
jgi:hypothetical protein